MGKRLPPGEAERRKAERAANFWSGKSYKKYDPSVEGYGSTEEWASAAKAFLSGNIFVAENKDADMALIGLEVMPVNEKALHKAWQKAVMKLFQEKGSDTAPGYKEAFLALKEASFRLSAKL